MVHVGWTKLPLLLQIPLTLQSLLMGKRSHFPPVGQSKLLSADLPLISESISVLFGLYFSYKTNMNFFSWKRQNWFFLDMKLKTTRLLKGLPRKKLEVNSVHVLEIYSQL